MTACEQQAQQCITYSVDIVRATMSTLFLQNIWHDLGQMGTTLNASDNASVGTSVIAVETKHIGRSSCTLITITDYDSYNGYRRFEDTADCNAANNAQSERQCNAQSTQQSECLNLNEENIKNNKEKERRKRRKKILVLFGFAIRVHRHAF